MRQKDIRPAPARIDFKGMKFLITDRPSDANMQTYLMVSCYRTNRSQLWALQTYIVTDISELL